MSSLLLLITCLALGMLTARGRPPEGLGKSLNWWVLNIALPALVLDTIPRLQFDWALWFLPASLWAVFFGAWGCSALLGRNLHWSRATTGAMVLTAGTSNTSFVGFPLIEALRGKDALTYAAVADQLGSFLVVAVGGTIVTAVYSGRTVSGVLIVRQIVCFPPFVATVIGLLVNWAGGWPVDLSPVLSRIGGTLTPLALFAVGLQLRLRPTAAHLPMLTFGLVWKLGLAPLLIYTLARAFAIDQPISTVATLQAAMAPMITAAILAEQYDLDPPLANLTAGMGILLSMATVPLWNLAL